MLGEDAVAPACLAQLYDGIDGKHQYQQTDDSNHGARLLGVSGDFALKLNLMLLLHHTLTCFLLGADGLHLVVFPQQAVGAGDVLATGESLGVVALQEEVEIIAGCRVVAHVGVGIRHVGVVLRAVEVDVAGAEMLGRLAVGAVVEQVGVLLEIVKEVDDGLPHIRNLVVAAIVVQHRDLTPQGNEGGIHLVEFAFAVELADDGVYLRQTLVNIVHSGEHQSYLRLVAQGFRLVAVFAAKLDKLGAPMYRLLVVVVLAASIYEHFEHVLLQRRVLIDRVERH